ncbi:MAG: discoidin domain-containing protein, partial [Candidatus Nealsonbacteria bacterium]|nr:discoidin domain-containing protein [Candidatus Nealsonbacteria bacterium]
MFVRRVLNFPLLSVWLMASATIIATVDTARAADAPVTESRAAVTASSVHSPPHQPQFAIDGDPKTRWASEAAGGRAEWLQIDLGKPTAVDNLIIHWETAHAAVYQIQVSDDGKTWQTLHEQKQGKGGKELIAGLDGKGRYLRVMCLKPNSYGLSSIWEIEFPDGDTARALADARRKAAEAQQKAQAEALRELAGTLGKYGVEEIVFALRQRGKDGHWYANFSYYSYDDKKMLYGHGGKLCRKNLRTAKLTTLIDDPQGAVRDPVVHYDAEKILFSYRKGGTEHYHLYEIDLDGTNLRQLTDGPFDDIEPCYLPDGDIVFVSSRCKRYVQCWLTKVAVLYRCGPDGKNMHAISANVEHDNTPWVLPDGRILYQRWEYVDRSQVHYHHLWTTNPDGTGQMVFFG